MSPTHSDRSAENGAKVNSMDGQEGATLTPPAFKLTAASQNPSGNPGGGTAQLKDGPGSGKAVAQLKAPTPEEFFAKYEAQVQRYLDFFYDKNPTRATFKKDKAEYVLTGSDFAVAAKSVYDSAETKDLGKIVPAELAVAQCLNEGGLTPETEDAYTTVNPFNVAITDGGKKGEKAKNLDKVKKEQGWAEARKLGIIAYYKLMYDSYMGKADSTEKMLEYDGFNQSGDKEYAGRFATAFYYEARMAGSIGIMHMHDDGKVLSGGVGKGKKNTNAPEDLKAIYTYIQSYDKFHNKLQPKIIYADLVKLKDDVPTVESMTAALLSIQNNEIVPAESTFGKAKSKVAKNMKADHPQDYQQQVDSRKEIADGIAGQYGTTIGFLYYHHELVTEGKVFGDSAAAPVAATATKKGTVTANSLKVRKGPGPENAEVGSLVEKARVDIHETKNGWLRIGEGKWVSAEYVLIDAVTPDTSTQKPEVKAEATPATKPEVKATVTPAAKPEAKATVTPATKPEVKAEDTPAAKPEVKAAVTPAAKPEVKAEVTPAAKPEAKGTAIQKGTVITESLRVRTGPGPENAEIGDGLREHDRVDIYETKNGWLRIGEGQWVKAEYVKIDVPTAKPALQKGTVTGDRLNVRTGPGQENPETGTKLAKNSEVVIYETKDGWLRIGEDQWVKGEYVKIEAAAEKPEAKPAAKPEVKPAAKPEAKPAAKSEDQPEEKIEIQPTVKAPAKTAAKSTAIPFEGRAVVSISGLVGQLGKKEKKDGKNQEADVKKIQQLLSDIGYKIVVDGGIGKNTIGAIASFQEASGISSDGRVDPDGTTLALMNATPDDAFSNNAENLKVDKDAPKLTHANWTNKEHLITDGSGNVIPRQHYANMNTLIQYMNIIADNLTGTFNVQSGYRSPFHNSNTEGSASQSNHQFGRAVDIKASDYTPKKLKAALLKLIKEGKIHDGGIGLYSWGCHYDIDNSRRWP